jgi:hypothetical protein
LLRIALKQK